jgi:nicotinamidase-related amidase
MAGAHRFPSSAKLLQTQQRWKEDLAMPGLSRGLILAALATGLLAFASGRPALAQRHATASQVPDPSSIQIPTLPGPTPVQLNPATTAFLVVDFVDRPDQNQMCMSRTPCQTTVPNVVAAVAQARAAGALIVYAINQGSTPVAELTPQPGDPLVVGGADRFYNTDLDSILKQAGITTVILTGLSTTGMGIYTAYSISEHGYTAIVPEDGVAGNTDFQSYYGLYQMLNEPGFGNPNNSLPKRGGVALTRTDLITYSSGGM